MKKEIIAFFKKNPHSALKSKQFAQKLNIQTEHDYLALKAVLHQLTAENVLERKGKKYALLSGETRTSVIGTLEITRQGFGFVTPDKKKLPDVFIAERNLNTALHGDSVEVALFAKQKKGAKNLEGEIIKIIRRKWERVSGVLKKGGALYYVVPDIPQIKRNIAIDPHELEGALPGDRVLVGNIEWYSREQSPEGKIISVYKQDGSFEADYAGIMAEFNLPSSFGGGAEREAEEIPEEISADEMLLRKDYRNEAVITIDPADAKDFDDALSVKKLENGNFEIGVHIADVAHYVARNSALDREARQRGNSVYLSGRVVPMLPERLSNGICSLKPDVERLTFTSVFEMTARGKINSFSFHKTIIRSKRRFTYEEVQKIIESGKGDYAAEILQLHKLALILRKKRMREGSVNFVTPEVRIVYGEDATPVDIVRQVSDDSHNLVEEFMLMANKLVAAHIHGLQKGRSGIPFVYRVHDVPQPEKLKDFIEVLRTIGHKKLPSAGSIRASDFNEIIAAVSGTPEEVLINELAIRTMSKAVYSPDNIGHYGLGFRLYTHFTSPIRRYSDLLVHRILHHYILSSGKAPYSREDIDGICEHLTFTERNAMEAERMSVKKKQIQFLASRIGEEFEAVVSGVTNFGLFVEIVDYLAEGLIHIRSLEEDYFIFDEKKHALIGRRSGLHYRLGDSVRVRLVALNEQKLEIDFIVIPR